MPNLVTRILFGKNRRRTVLRAATLVGITILVFRFILAPLRLEGESMEPNYSAGQLSLANRLSYLNSSPQRGDVVAVRLRDGGNSVYLLKRIVGLPGESVGFEAGKLTVDGEPQDEHYLVYESDWNREPALCEANEYFVVGDNRSMPIHMHTFGRTTRSRIVGKVIF